MKASSLSLRKSRIYPITDRRLTGMSHAEQVVKLCQGGATLIQLREKELSSVDFYRQALEAFAETRNRGARLIVNDRVDIALALGVDGVHLGRNDLPPVAARRLLGEDAVIGYSTHTVEQAVEGSKLPVDYLAIGPIFSTSSKTDAEQVVGLDGLRKVRAAVRNTQLVAIGGISHENASLVLEAGADAVAVLSAVLTPPTAIVDSMKRLFATTSQPS